MAAFTQVKSFQDYVEDSIKLASADLLRSNHKILALEDMIKGIEEEKQHLGAKIRDCFSIGVFCRKDLYKSISRQGLLLSQLEVLDQKIVSLQEKILLEEERYAQYNFTMNKLNKRSFMLEEYCKKIKNALCRQAESKAENEIEELSIYGK